VEVSDDRTVLDADSVGADVLYEHSLAAGMSRYDR